MLHGRAHVGIAFDAEAGEQPDALARVLVDAVRRLRVNGLNDGRHSPRICMGRFSAKERCRVADNRGGLPDDPAPTSPSMVKVLMEKLSREARRGSPPAFSNSKNARSRPRLGTCITRVRMCH